MFGNARNLEGDNTFSSEKKYDVIKVKPLYILSLHIFLYLDNI